MPITTRGRSSLSAYYVDEPSPEIDWEFVDDVVRDFTRTAHADFVDMNIDGEVRMWTVSQMFIGWLASPVTAPSNRELQTHWGVAVRSARIAGSNESFGAYRDSCAQGAAAEACILRAIAYQMRDTDLQPCFVQLLHRDVQNRNSCCCTVCDACGNHGDDDDESFCENCARCYSCCACCVCVSCGSRCSELACHDCEHCETCGCSCYRCHNCDERQSRSSDLCSDCDTCSGCCECEGGHSAMRGTRLKRKSYDLHKFVVSGKQKQNTLTRLLGAEIEVAKGAEHAAVRVPLTKWSANVVNDGSLPDSGSEVVTQPAAGDQWVDMIGDITNGLTHPGCGASTNNSCGLHVHVDAGDLTVWDVKRFVKLYAHVEQAMFDLTDVDPHRCYRYAKPCGSEFVTMLADCNGKGIKSAFLKKHYKVAVEPVAYRNGKYVDRTPQEMAREEQRIIKDATTHKYNDARYRAVNLHSYFFRGTIEFRHHHGTIDREAITNWGIVCGSLVEWASKHNDADFANLAISGRSSKKVLELVVGQKSVVAWMRARWNREGERVKLATILNTRY